MDVLALTHGSSPAVLGGKLGTLDSHLGRLVLARIGGSTTLGSQFLTRLSVVVMYVNGAQVLGFTLAKALGMVKALVDQTLPGTRVSLATGAVTALLAHLDTMLGELMSTATGSDLGAQLLANLATTHIKSLGSVDVITRVTVTALGICSLETSLANCLDLVDLAMTLGLSSTKGDLVLVAHVLETLVLARVGIARAVLESTTHTLAHSILGTLVFAVKATKLVAKLKGKLAALDLHLFTRGIIGTRGVVTTTLSGTTNTSLANMGKDVDLTMTVGFVLTELSINGIADVLHPLVLARILGEAVFGTTLETLALSILSLLVTTVLLSNPGTEFLSHLAALDSKMSGGRNVLARVGTIALLTNASTAILANRLVVVDAAMKLGLVITILGLSLVAFSLENLVCT
mmetsp:Transcript_48055/g.66717  ORF Transcript_48055/g.66717 Transcript_48055/m.66717 type:complete len:403 (+) Transcript_48055:939-2147(+)